MSAGPIGAFEEDADHVHAFWFQEVGPERWWVRSPDVDAAIIGRFAATWDKWRHQPSDAFLRSPEMAVSAVVLFDQFPRNMFRGEARAFATDPLAHAIAHGALERDFDRTMSEGERSFLYMPFMHAENSAEQERSVRLFTELGWADPLRFAHLHRDMIARHGRFPARNAALGRADRPGEAAAITESKSW